MRADQFIIITNIEFERREGWQRRNKVKGKGKEQWLTIPVTGSDYQMIKDVAIDNTHKWQHRHRKTIENLYGKTNEKEVMADILGIYTRKWERLADINIAFIQLFRTVLEIPTPLIVDEETTGKKHDLHINICNKYNANTYLSGHGAKAYMNEEYLSRMADNGISIQFIDNSPIATYPYSVVHHLLTEGRTQTKRILGTL